MLPKSITFLSATHSEYQGFVWIARVLFAVSVEIQFAPGLQRVTRGFRQVFPGNGGRWEPFCETSFARRKGASTVASSAPEDSDSVCERNVCWPKPYRMVITFLRHLPISRTLKMLRHCDTLRSLRFLAALDLLGRCPHHVFGNLAIRSLSRKLLWRLQLP